MDEIAIIIPSRLAATRLPRKPLKIVGSKEMILHVCDRARSAKIGKVYVATPDKEIFDLVKKNGHESFLTKINHKTGTDRVFEVFDIKLKRKPNIIINLQGDMPNIVFTSIKALANQMIKEKSEIATLASNLETEEKGDENIVKVITENDISNGQFSTAKDFLRKINNSIPKNVYHHIGIYAFTNKALLRYVSLKRTKLEIDRNLEQMRALENNMKIDVKFVSSNPLSIDTNEDLNKIKKIMEKK